MKKKKTFFLVYILHNYINLFLSAKYKLFSLNMNIYLNKKNRLWKNLRFFLCIKLILFIFFKLSMLLKDYIEIIYNYLYFTYNTYNLLNFFFHLLTFPQYFFFSSANNK